MGWTLQIMLQYSYTTWGCADSFDLLSQYSTEGFDPGWWLTLMRLLGPWEHKRSCVQTGWCAGESPATETLAMSLTWGCRWLVRSGVLFVPPIYKTYFIFSFIEVGESNFIRVKWKRLFLFCFACQLAYGQVTCKLFNHYFLKVCQSNNSRIVKTWWSCVHMCNELLCQNLILLPATNSKSYVKSPW
jgi:hypothetical protein